MGLTTVDERVRFLLEPGAEPVAGRLDSLRCLVAAGVSCEARMDPLVSGLTDVPERFAATLGALLGQRPILETVVDPALIGGAVLRIGDTVYDGSVANQLQFIRQQMIDRSVHEIQSRRNSFRYPAGS